jgi:putative sterol carrier protein
MPRFPGPEWLVAYKEAIDASDELAEAAKDWNRDITIVVEAEPDKGVPNETWAWFHIQGGKVTDAKLVGPEEGERAEFVILAPYSRWKEVILGKLDPIRGMLQGKLKVKGDLKALTEEVKAAHALVKVASSIPSEFADD